MEEKLESVPCENCPKTVKEGDIFFDKETNKRYCCGDCAKAGKRDNVCEFC